MVILRSQNKITDFLMILAWASPFNKDTPSRFLAKMFIFVLVPRKICLIIHPTDYVVYLAVESPSPLIYVLSPPSARTLLPHIVNS